ncbi:MAG TPA: hypothetical protein ENK01_04875 [Hellea balneolensis]|uniref:Uncharacterized protein n=1 Tax=Hellea balneolensis TaxID=287478 RepID=A0A7V5NY33_9PROT|nr:hypothetical protein [Hellea balneolensis]
MSMNSIFKSTLISGACVAGLTLSACASGGAGGSSRYGSVYDYESGGSCGGTPACGAVIAQPAPVPAPVYQAPAPAPAPVYQAPSQSYSGPVSCPAGTTPAGDGTCLQSGSVSSGSYTDYGTTTTTTTSGAPAACPAGTTPNGDGSCMMTSDTGLYSGSSSTTSSSGTVYSGTSSSQMADCPAGTTPNGDGSCMMTSGTQPTVTIYDQHTTGYEAPPVDYVPPTYQPIRK